MQFGMKFKGLIGNQSVENFTCKLQRFQAMFLKDNLSKIEVIQNFYFICILKIQVIKKIFLTNLSKKPDYLEEDKCMTT